MPLKTLIVDDEPIARKVLREELESIEGIEIIGEAGDGEMALGKIRPINRILCFWICRCPPWGG